MKEAQHDLDQDFENWLLDLDIGIRKSQFDRVREALVSEHSKRSKTSQFRKYTVEVAKLYKRLAMPNQAIKMLFPLVSNQSKVAASPAALAEFAASIFMLGADVEAKNILDEIVPQNYPEALLYSAFIYFKNWEYALAVGPLRRFIGLVEKQNNRYAALLGKTNLSAALVASSQVEEALPIIQASLLETQSEGYKLLHGNLLEIRAQAFVTRQDWSQAQKALLAARDFHKGASPLNTLLLDKWDVLIELRKNGFSSKIKRQLDQLRMRAEQLRHFETIRQVDLYEAGASQNYDLATKLYFGAGSIGFRKIVKAQIGESFIPPDEYVYQVTMNDQAATNRCEINLNSGQVHLTKGARAKVLEVFKPGHTSHRFVYAFAKDFYRPPTIGFLFQELYPDQSFDPEVVNNRIHQIIFRTRNVFEKIKCPLDFQVVNGRFFLQSSMNLFLRIPRLNFENSVEISKEYFKQNSWLLRLEKNKHYKIRELLKLTRLNRKALFQELKQALQSGTLSKIGSGVGVKYLRNDL